MNDDDESFFPFYILVLEFLYCNKWRLRCNECESDLIQFGKIWFFSSGIPCHYYILLKANVGCEMGFPDCPKKFAIF